MAFSFDSRDLAVLANAVSSVETINNELAEEGLSVDKVTVVTEDGTPLGTIEWSEATDAWAFVPKR